MIIGTTSMGAALRRRADKTMFGLETPACRQDEASARSSRRAAPGWVTGERTSSAEQCARDRCGPWVAHDDGYIEEGCENRKSSR